jgi:hypothetical protein
LLLVQPARLELALLDPQVARDVIALLAVAKSPLDVAIY